MEYVLCGQDLTSSVVFNRVEEKLANLRVFIQGAEPQFDRFIDAAVSASGLLDYKYFPPLCYEIWNAIPLTAGSQGARAYLAMTLLQGMKKTLGGDRLAALPNRVREAQLKHFEWLATQLTGHESWLALDNDTFQKEFGLSTLRLYVCGAQLVDYRCGVPRSIVMNSGTGGVLSNMAYFIGIGGFKPFFQIHTHVHRLDQFTEAGWNECYRCCAELYSVHPDVLGMYGGSWFYDPGIKEVSPRLRYLQDIPLASGARLFRSGPSEACTKDATSTSPTRKELFDKGLYAPCAYVLVWDRVSQTRWAAGTAA